VLQTYEEYVFLLNIILYIYQQFKCLTTDCCRLLGSVRNKAMPVSNEILIESDLFVFAVQVK
jgi:hypothetical protein